MFRSVSVSVSARALLPLLICAACGEDSFTPVDASDDNVDAAAATDDAAVDATADDAAADAALDAAPAPVQVTVYANGGLAAGVAVQYHGADGAYLGTVTTDTAGAATITDLPAGGAVTTPVSAGGNPDNHTLTTILDVQPGDHLTFGTSGLRLPSRMGAVSITTASTPSGLHEVNVPCGRIGMGAAQTSSTSMPAGCLAPDATTIDAVVYTGSGVGIVTGAPITGTAPNRTASITFTTTTGASASHTVSFTNVAGAQNIRPGVWASRGGIPYWRHGITVFGGSASGTVTTGYADEFFDEAGPALTVSYDNNAAENEVVVRSANVATAAAPLSFAFDGATDLPGKLQDVAVTGTPETVTWTEPTWGCRDNPGRPDALHVRISGYAASAFFGSGTSYYWELIAPGTTTGTITMPVLDPSTIATLWPGATFANMTPRVTFTSDSTLDWNAVRTSTRPFDIAHQYPAATGTRCTMSVQPPIIR